MTTACPFVEVISAIAPCGIGRIYEATGWAFHHEFFLCHYSP
jgi:hypothetical protein